MHKNMKKSGEKMGKKIKVMLSNRHAHITKETAEILFGENGLTGNGPIDGKDPVICNETLAVQGPNGKIEKVKILVPFRKHNQVELLMSDCYKLGISAPIGISIKDKSNESNAAKLKLIGPKGEIESNCGIVAHRHIHLNVVEAEKFNIQDRQVVSVKAGTERQVIFNNVIIKVTSLVETVMHVDIEEGNASGIKNGDEVEIL